MLSARVGLSLGQLRLDLPLDVERGETVVLLGPNGAGKTTFLRTIAGLQPIDDGLVSLDGAPWDDPATGDWVEPDRRRVGFVFQRYLLFPHLSAIDNVAFGLRRSGRSAADAREIAVDWLDRLGIADQAPLRPAQLSGGQSQRVAIARALVTDPEVLLLDEPFAALDATARVEVREQLAELLAGFGGATVLVTHDTADAAHIGRRVVVLEDGLATFEGDWPDLITSATTAFHRSLFVR